MKTIGLTIGASFLVLSGWALASQPAEQKDSPHPSMMEEMMKDGKEGEHMGGMMRMMKMMDRCAAMMESMQTQSEKTEQEQQK